MNKRYQVPARDHLEVLYDLEARLYEFLQTLFRDLREAITIMAMDENPQACKDRLTQWGMDPMLTLFDGVRFSRIRCGRYRFYLNAPVYFDSLWLTRNEFYWLRRTLTRGIFEAFLLIRLGLPQFDLAEALALIREGPGPEAAEVVRQVFYLAWDGYEEGHDREALTQVLELFPDYYEVLEWVLAEVLT